MSKDATSWTHNYNAFRLLELPESMIGKNYLCKCLKCKTPMNALGESYMGEYVFWKCPECNSERTINGRDRRFKRTYSQRQLKQLEAKEYYKVTNE